MSVAEKSSLPKLALVPMTEKRWKRKMNALFLHIAVYRRT